MMENNTTILDLKNYLLERIEQNKINHDLKKEFIISGTIVSNAYYIDSNQSSISVEIKDKYGADTKVFISDKNKLGVDKDDLKEGNQIILKCMPYINKTGYIKNYDIMQVRAIAIKVVFIYEIYKNELLERIKNQKRRKFLNFNGKDSMRVYIIAPDSCSLNDVIDSFKSYNFFKLYYKTVNTSNALEISSTIHDANESDVDIIVIARGGTTNLQVYDDESIINEILRSHKFVITALGHTENHTLADDAADKFLNAPVQVGEHLISQYNKYKNRTLNNIKIDNTIQNYNNENQKTKYSFTKGLALGFFVGIISMILFIIWAGINA